MRDITQDEKRFAARMSALNEAAMDYVGARVRDELFGATSVRGRLRSTTAHTVVSTRPKTPAAELRLRMGLKAPALGS